MKTTIELNLSEQKHRQALRALIDILDDAPPEGLDISSGATGTYDPERVTMWTSTEGAKLVKEEVNLNPSVDPEDVVVKTVDQPEEKPKKETKPKKEKKTSHVQAPTDEDARAIVEAVVGVKTGKGTEVEGTAEEVAEVLDGEKVSDDTIVELRKLQVKLAKYQALDEMKEIIRNVTGIQKGKIADIPAKFGEKLIEDLTAAAKRLEDEGK